MNQHTQINLAGKPVIANYNCIQSWTGLHPGIGNFADDPLFVDALGADGVAGTDDDDHRLRPGSRSISTGDPAYVPAPLEIDLQGSPRLQGGRVDRGAYEAQIEQIPPDFDENGLINLADLAGFQLCMGSSGAMAKRSAAMRSHRTFNMPAPRLGRVLGMPPIDWVDICLCLFDANNSEDIDLFDFADFQAMLAGSGP